MFHHQSLFFCIKCFGSSNRLTETSENILSQFLTIHQIFFTGLLCVWFLGSICLTNSVIDVQLFCSLPNILSVISFQFYSFPTDHFLWSGGWCVPLSCPTSSLLPKIANTTQKPILILYVLCIRQEMYTTIKTPKKRPMLYSKLSIIFW